MLLATGGRRRDVYSAANVVGPNISVAAEWPVRKPKHLIGHRVAESPGKLRPAFCLHDLTRMGNELSQALATLGAVCTC
jgi:hypothetical protein